MRSTVFLEPALRFSILIERRWQGIRLLLGRVVPEPQPGGGHGRNAYRTDGSILPGAVHQVTSKQRAYTPVI